MSVGQLYVHVHAIFESEDDSRQLVCLEVEFCNLGPGVVVMVSVSVLELYC